MGCRFMQRADSVNDQLLQKIKKYTPRPEMIDLYKIVLQQSWQAQSAHIVSGKQELMKEIKQLEEKLSYIRDLLSSKKIEPDDFKEMKFDYSTKLEKLEAKLAGLHHNDVDIKKLLDRGINVLLRISTAYEKVKLKKRGQ